MIIVRFLIKFFALLLTNLILLQHQFFTYAEQISDFPYLPLPNLQVSAATSFSTNYILFPTNFVLSSKSFVLSLPDRQTY